MVKAQVKGGRKMKKSISIVLTTVLLTCNLTIAAPFSTNHVLAASNDISVKLSNFLGNVTQVPLELTDTYYVNNNTATTLTKGTVYTLKVENGAFNLYNGTSKVASYGSSFTLTPSTYNSTHLIKLNGRSYLGSMNFTIESGYIRPINTLPYEDYLKGVVPREMPASWNEEALKAQTIAARTFSIDDIGKTVLDTQGYQVYGGYVVDQYTDKINRVIDSTQNQVLKYNGGLISALYSSSNGGKILSNTNTYGTTNVPYFVTKNDPYDLAATANPNMNWSFAVNKTQLDMTGKSLATPASWWSTATEKDASLMSSFKSGLKTYGYVASNYDIKILSISELSFTTSYTQTQRIDGHVKVNYYLKDTSTGAYVMENGLLKTNTTTIDRRAYDVRSMFGSTLMKSPYVKSVTSSSTAFTVNGGGWGHGIGMSQYGANEMGKKGFNYQSILSFYYPGTTLYGAGSNGGTTTPPPADTTPPVISSVQATVGSQNNVSVSYSTNEDATTTVALLNSNNTTVATLKNATLESAGTKSFTWSGKDITAGTYTLVITSTDAAGNKATATKSITLVPLFQSFSISMIDNTYLYDTTTSLKSVSVIGPQSVTVIGQQGDWYQINTWLGPKWIRPLNVVVDVSKKVTLMENTPMYNNVKDTKSISTLGLQTVTVKAQLKGTNWYKINSWLGDKWIYSDHLIEGETQKLSTTLTVFDNASLYNVPFSNTTKVSTIGPQKVQVVEKWNNWYKIKTWLGDKWIIPTYKVEGTIKSISSTLYLTNVTTLHDAPFEDKATTLALSPQSVKATEEWNGWYKINTWLGPKWIQPNV